MQAPISPLPEISHDAAIMVVGKLPGELVLILRRFSGKLFLYGDTIRSVISNQRPKYVDLCCASRSVMTEVVAFIGKRHVIAQERNSYICEISGLSYQISTLGFYANPGEVVAMGDFSISRVCGYYCPEKHRVRIITDPDFLTDIALRRISFRRDSKDINPMRSLHHAFRLAKDGYEISRESYEALIFKLADEFAGFFDKNTINDAARLRIREALQDALPQLSGADNL